MEDPPPPTITGQRTAPVTQRPPIPPPPPGSSPPPPSFPAALCLLGSASAADPAPRTAPAARCHALPAAGGEHGDTHRLRSPQRPPPPRTALLLFLFCFSLRFSPEETYSRASAARQPPPPPRRAGGRPTPSPGLRRRLGVPEGRRGEGGEAAGSGAGRVQAASPRRGEGEEDWGGGGGIQQSFASPAPRCAAPSVPGGPVPP